MHFLTVLIHDEHLDPPPPPQHTYRKGWDAKQAAQWERGGHCTRQDPITWQVDCNLPHVADHDAYHIQNQSAR